MKTCGFEGCGSLITTENKKAKYCCPRCANLAWRKVNRQRQNERQREYTRERSQAKRPPESIDWEERKIAILKKYGVGEKWKKLRQ